MVVEQNLGVFQPIYRSTDGGSTWTCIYAGGTYPSPTPTTPDAPSRGPGYFSDAPSCVIINPANNKQVWLSDGGLIWMTTDITASPIVWTTCSYGIEELCVESAVSAPSGANLMIGVMDRNGFRLTDFSPTAPYPDKQFDALSTDWNSPTTSLDYCETDPNYYVRAGNGWHGTSSANVYTTTSNGNGGRYSWTKQPWPYTGSIAQVAVSSTKQANGYPVIVAIPENSAPVRSLDYGATWSASTGAVGISGQTQITFNRRNLAADKVNGNKFYFLDYTTGKFYKSTDGAASFTNSATLPVQGTESYVGAQFSHTVVKAKPGVEDEVWVSLYNKGLWYSTDGGSTFTQITNVQLAMSFSFGANPPGQSYPAVFVYGTVNNVQGIFRSDDNGATWAQIDSPNNRIGDVPGDIEGDRQVYGRVFVPTVGRGVIYGGFATNNTYDDCTNFNNVYSHEPHMTNVLTANATQPNSGVPAPTPLRGYIKTGQIAAGDTATQGQLIYNEPTGITNFSFYTQYWGGQVQGTYDYLYDFKIYISPDNVNYTQLLQTTGTAVGFNNTSVNVGSNYACINYYLNPGCTLPAGTKYLKIQYPLANTAGANMFVGGVNISALSTVTDNSTNFSNVYKYEPHMTAIVTANGPTPNSGVPAPAPVIGYLKTGQVAANDPTTQGYVIYNEPGNITNFNFYAQYWGGQVQGTHDGLYDFKIYISSDNVNYTQLLQTTGSDVGFNVAYQNVGSGYTCINYYLNPSCTLPAGTKYLKIQYPLANTAGANMFMGNMNISYSPY
jgi:hypothetical protein